MENSQDIDVIITGADILARGVLMALQENSMDKKILLTGQNADLESVKDIVAGRQTMTIYKPLRILAENAAEMAIRVATGKEKALSLL